MVRLILGEAGTGKTELVYRQLRQSVEEGRRAILLVPEQYSFEAEKAVYQRLGAVLALRVEVLSFTRLSNLVFRECGGLAGRALDDCARVLLMSIALGEVQDALTVFSRHPNNPSFVASMVAMINEFKNAGVTPEGLDELKSHLPGGALREKLEELSLIYSTYQAFVQRSYVDQKDDLMRAAGYLEGKPVFKGYDIYCDSFKGFMAGEYRLLQYLMRDGKDIVFSFSTDGIADAEEGTGVFSPVKQTIRRLIRMAGEAGQPVQTPAVQREFYRFRSPELSHIASQLFRRPEEYRGWRGGESISLVQALNPYEEIEGIAGRISALVRERGLRYREIAVIARSLEPYQTAVESVFRRYGIPYFMDKQVDAETHPLTTLVLTALEAVRGGLDTGRILRLAKSPLIGLDLYSAALLENYCYIWRIEKEQWNAPFQNHPDGFGGRSGRGENETKMDEDAAQRLAAAEEARQKLITPLLRLRERLEDCDGGGFAKAVFAYLEESGAVERLSSLEELSDSLSSQVWDSLTVILDRFFLVMQGIRLPAARFTELLRLSLQTMEIALIPQTNDQVLVGAADRVRPQNPRAVFVIGANLGIFPARAEAGGVLTEEDRRKLSESGIEIAETLEERAVSEKYWAYAAMTAPSQYLWVSYSAAGLDGRARYPSTLVEQLRRMFPGLELEAERHSLSQVVNEATAFTAFCRRAASPDWRGTAEGAALEEYLRETAYSGRLKQVEALREEPSYSLSPGQASALFGRTMHISPTRADDFASCPFRYFLRHALRLRPRRRAELTPLESGSALHFVLSAMVQAHPSRELGELSQQQLEEEVDALLEKFLKENMDRRDESPARFAYLYRRLRTTLLFLLRHLGAEMGQSRFAPVAFELPISRERGAPPLEFTSRDGVRILLEGTVDRVDAYTRPEDGKEFIRVVDYKSGRKQFDLNDLLNGLEMQMPIYLFTLCRGEDPLPAGVLYMPARAEAVEAGREDNPSKVRESFESKMRMNGLLLMDYEVLEAMEEDLTGKFIPVKKTASGLSAQSKKNTVTAGEWDILRDYVVQKAKEMAEQLHGGRVDNIPLLSKEGRLVCEYCEYQAVCGHEKDSSKRREAADLPREEILKKMQEAAAKDVPPHFDSP